MFLRWKFHRQRRRRDHYHQRHHDDDQALLKIFAHHTDPVTMIK